MMLPEPIRKQLLTLLRSQYGPSTELKSMQHLSGGSINNALKIETSRGPFFIKWNYSQRFPGMFASEAKGLDILNQANGLPVPKVLHHREEKEYTFLILEYIESGQKQQHFWSEFGNQLASLHCNREDFFGLDHDNYIGSLPQSNFKHPNWVEFFVLERLEKQLKLAKNTNKIEGASLAAFDRLFNRLDGLIPVEPPALVHGDLWSGNFMVNRNGTACLIDPAVYYGHREMDLGMSKLFGGFDEPFYAAYNESYPMEYGWEERLDICNLYPLLVHVNLFGGSYWSSVKQIVNRF